MDLEPVTSEEEDEGQNQNIDAMLRQHLNINIEQQFGQPP